MGGWHSQPEHTARGTSSLLAPLLGGFREDYKVDEGGDGRA
eukprot:CAMPEP_0196708492 /NCGR_PEP_ID=MMETSP1090-20130531/66121_1 /TAXON_ID=37098 /ORGANISM="Isochrysis sp, Strain CCMP1244" /LENGTH=40 /DNA_ID= /DNA_START= /DNA_END= /DNA_ORIENTATION=